ncbi:XRE family transcriptional regulator [Eubacterium sp. AM28-29]|nr:XRE family transcriptional regulator [Eubacterium sp. AM28-29]
MISYAPLRKILKERHISTYYLRTKCGNLNIDAKTIHNLMTDQSVTTYTLDKLCQILECDLSEIAVFVNDTK